MKRLLFFENAKLIKEKFDIIPLMYGSLGLEHITGKSFDADDIDAEVICCGRKLPLLQAKEADSDHFLNIEKIEDDFYITFSHPMTKEHYISFVSYVRFDRVLTAKLYPEQGGEVRFPQMRGGKLYYYCNMHGLYEIVNIKK